MLPAVGDIDVQSTLTSLVVLCGGIAAAVAGIRQGLKKVRANEPDPGARLTGGVLMDNTSMALLSERLRDAADAMRENTAAQRECAHQVERLRDRMP